MQAATTHSREQLLESLGAYFDAGGLERDLARRIAWQTESDTGAPVPALEGYLREEMAPTLERMGFDCEIAPNPDPRGGPFLLARRTEDPALPTVLGYAHGDVVNGHEGRWRDGLSPWRLNTEGGRWYGRGTADNKGQHSINLAALEHTMRARRGRLGYNVALLLEMGEEAGSPGLHAFCAQRREALRAQLFLASDACVPPRYRPRCAVPCTGSRPVVARTTRRSTRTGVSPG